MLLIIEWDLDVCDDRAKINIRRGVEVGEIRWLTDNTPNGGISAMQIHIDAPDKSGQVVCRFGLTWSDSEWNSASASLLTISCLSPPAHKFFALHARWQP